MKIAKRRHRDRWWDAGRAMQAVDAEDMPHSLRKQLAELEMVDARLLIDYWVAAKRLEVFSLYFVEDKVPEDLPAIAEIAAELTAAVAELAEIIERWTPPPEPQPWVDKARAARYGITPDHALRVLESQGHACALCRSVFTDPKAMHMDHNHATGTFRGFLCHTCNTGLGFLKDSPSVLANALAYLQHHGHYGPEVDQ